MESSRFPHEIQPSEDASHRQVPGKKLPHESFQIFGFCIKNLKFWNKLDGNHQSGFCECDERVKHEPTFATDHIMNAFTVSKRPKVFLINLWFL